MERKELIKKVRLRGLSRKEAKIAVNAVWGAIEKGLETSRFVKLPHPTDSSRVLIAYRGNEK